MKINKFCDEKAATLCVYLTIRDGCSSTRILIFFF